MPKVKIDAQGHITLPKDLIERFKLSAGEYLEVYPTEVGIILVPEKTIPKDQQWFWTHEWQQMYQEALEDVKAGRVKAFDDVEALIQDLNA